MNILVRVLVASDYDAGVNAAKIELNDAAIKHILQLSKKAGKNNTISEFDYSPELGTTDIDLEDNDLDNGSTLSYRDIDKLSDEESQQAVFGLSEDARKDCVSLNVNDTDFWWDGYLKHSEIKWDTSLIPLSFLPQELNVKPTPKKKSDLNMTTEQINAIHEKIARGINHGLNAREIVDTFQRHITKAQLVRVIWELIERGHK
jgi:hypothetical protein